MGDKRKTGHTTSNNPANTTNNSIGNTLPTSNISNKELEAVVKSGVSIGAVTSKSEFNKEVLYKESRSLLKTTARSVGRERDGTQLSLFVIPEFQDRELNRSNYPQKAGVLMQFIMKEWQLRPKDSNGYLVIENLQAVADTVNTTTQKLKIYLLMLGGYTYPIMKTRIDGKTGRKVTTFSQEQLFKIEVDYYTDNLDISVENKVGTSLVSFVKNAPVKEVRIKPCDTLINNISGEKRGVGLGYVLATEDTATIGLGLGTWAYKLFCLSGGEKPTYKIGWSNLIEKLGVSKEDLTKQGKPRIRKQIEQGLDELRDKGHLEYWKFNKERELYDWKYTDMYLRHKDGVKKLTQ
jgi:hypothetical protein